MVQILAVCCLVVVGWPTTTQGIQPLVQRAGTPAGYSTRYLLPSGISGPRLSPGFQNGFGRPAPSQIYFTPAGFGSQVSPNTFQHASPQIYFTPAGFGSQGSHNTFQHASPQRYLPPSGSSGPGLSPGFQNGFGRPAPSQIYSTPAGFGSQGSPNTFQHASPQRYLPPSGSSGPGLSPGFQNGFGRPAPSQNYSAPAASGSQGNTSGFPNTFQRYPPPPGSSGSGISPGSPNGFNQPAINQLGPQYLKFPSGMSYMDPERNLSIELLYRPINNFTKGFNLDFEIKNGKEESATLSFSSTAGRGGVSLSIQDLLTTVLGAINNTIFEYTGPDDDGFVSAPAPLPVDNGSSPNLEEERNPGSTGNLGMNSLPGGRDEGAPSCPDCPLAPRFNETGATPPIKKTKP